MDGWNAALLLLPAELRCALRSNTVWAKAEELRLRLGREATALIAGQETPILPGHTVTKAMLERLAELAGGASPYAVEECMARGYLPWKNGVRIALCGAMTAGSERRWTLGALSSAVIRIPREARGCASPFCRAVPEPTLILSPPGGGKTTLLRDLIRLYSDKGFRVSLSDERGEVAAYGAEGFAYDVGAHTDVMSFCPRREAVPLLLRLVSPQVLAMDEITEPEDAEVCRLAANCGVMLLATAHAASAEELSRRAVFAALLREKVFSRCICIENRGGKRTYREERL